MRDVGRRARPTVAGMNSTRVQAKFTKNLILMRVLLAPLVAFTLFFAHVDDLSSVASAKEDVLAHLRAGHPRLLFTDEQLATAVAAAKTDPLRAQLHARIVALAEADLDV